MTDIRGAAQYWARTWREAWEARDVEQVLTPYAPEIVYWSEPFREPYRGLDGVREYVSGAFDTESSVNAWFSEAPVVDGDRAVVSWWATLIEEGEPITLSGHSMLRFNDDGLVVEQWDAWNQADTMRQRPPGWAG
jgi:ketosteroid isomerase-like protein